ncbi:hypothetical protein BOX15_Mlig005469g1 [Macrostomum lignano]|uniref:Surfeit locus protein 4 homolog n=1 Tax=Macrostomum lignano TaxID=282301 RepID=A0A267DJT2_9PLAT|nr:hypothetical protein BOX15_Mlig013740g2 [Macrostomum lignano]PAA50608.1 hypothetical protein BOX15_Mlig028489g1 [Macrostomum lignano]PAA59856.1 hypothetical protein BOX15_Mlig005469g1 [Macrostomum lignano]
MQMTSNSTVKKYLKAAEDAADEVQRRGKHILPTVSRLLLLSTYLEDGVRMLTHWSMQANYVSREWNVFALLGHLFVLINMICQLVGSGLVLARVQVPIACAILGGNTLMQIIVYKIIFEDFSYLLRLVAITGGLLLLYVESQNEGRVVFGGLPSISENKPKRWLQLSGRLLLVLMLVSLVRFQEGLDILVSLISLIAAALIAIGFKTRPVALGAAVLLFVLNLFSHPFWSFNEKHLEMLRDFVKYDFFQTLSAVGGLLMIVAVGPGDVSLDQRKKDW